MSKKRDAAHRNVNVGLIPEPERRGHGQKARLERLPGLTQGQSLTHSGFES